MPEDEFLESTLEVTISRDMRNLIRTASQQHALLLVLEGAGIGARALLGESPTEIGRGPTCHLILDADSVSRKHARIEWVDGAHRVTDLGSTNGTFINGERIQEQVLHDGDRLSIGKVPLKYVAGGNIEGAYHEQIQRLMRIDSLTGALNKRTFEDTLRGAVQNARTQPRSISLIVFDLDHFKRINDTHGHPIGDRVLQEMARTVIRVNSPEQVFGRVGGEEFAVLWDGAERLAAHQHAERLREAVAAQPIECEGVKLALTVSLGVAERLPSSDEAPEEVYKRADEKLYEAKANGRNQVRS